MTNPVPVETNRAHLPQSDPRCDTVVVLNMAARSRPGHRYADMNAVRGLEYDYNLHWVEGPELNQFHYLWTGKYTRIKGRKVEVRVRMPENLRHRHVNQFPHAHVVRWRSTPTGHGSKRVATVGQRQAQAKRRFVAICWELKSSDYGSNQTYADRFVQAVVKAGGKAYYMTLVVMKNWGPKLKAFHIAVEKYARSKSGTALLAHGAPKPANLGVYYPEYIDRIWNHFA